MIPMRQGCCSSLPRASIALLLILAGCAGSNPPSETRRRPIHGELVDANGPAEVLLEPPAQPEKPLGAVQAIAWGGTPRDPLLAVTWSCGRMALYQPLRDTRPTSWGTLPADRGAVRAIAVLENERIVLGDDRGLLEWNPSNLGGPKALDLLDCGAVGAIAVDARTRADVVVGLVSGALIRVRVPEVSGGSAQRIAEWRSSGRNGAIRQLAFRARGRSLLLLREPGVLVEVPSNLVGEATFLAHARAFASDSENLALLGPDGILSFQIAPAEAEPRRLLLTLPPCSIAFVGSAPTLLILQPGGLILVAPHDPLSRLEALPRAFWTKPSRQRGWTCLASSAGDNPLIAAGDEAGAIHVASLKTVQAQSRLPAQKDLPAIALRPERRFLLPRASESRLDGPPQLVQRLQVLRDRLASGQSLGIGAEIARLRSDESITRLISAELSVLEAALMQSEGRDPSSVLQAFANASDEFRLLGRVDRQAELAFWAGLLQLPSFDGTGHRIDSGTIERGASSLLLAAELAREGLSSDSSFLTFCQASLAWALLGRNRPEEAQRLFAPLRDRIAADPYLSQVPELTRIASALAAARGDWLEVDRLTQKALDRANSGESIHLRRELLLDRLGALAALGRFTEAWQLSRSWPGGELDVSWRRIVLGRLAGVPPTPLPARGHESLSVGPLDWWQAFCSAEDPTRALEELALAIEGVRSTGRLDLVAEAELVRAETLERAGRTAEAIPIYNELAQRAGPPLAEPRTRGAATLARWIPPRACRGLARCLLLAKDPAQAWKAIQLAEWVDWQESLGGDRLRLLLSRDSIQPSDLAAWRHAQLDARNRPSPFPEVDHCNLHAGLRLVEERCGARAMDGEQEETALLGGDPESGDSPGQAFLAFTKMGPESLVGWMFRPGLPPIVRPIPARRSDLREVARRWRAGLGDGGRPDPLEPPASPDRLLTPWDEPDLSFGSRAKPLDVASNPAEYLREALFGPFRIELAQCRRVRLLPGEPLASLPAAWLAYPLLGDRNPQWVLASSTIRLPRPPSKTDGEPVGSLAIGISPAEAILLGRIHRASETTLDTILQGEPTRVFWERLEDRPYRTLHIAGRFLNSPSHSPTGGYLIQTGSDGSGSLTLGDLSRAELQGALVILSPRAARGSGLASPLVWQEMARAWLAAGAGGVIVGLWDLPPEAQAAFSLALHAALLDGLQPEEALRQAQATLRTDPLLADPVVWASHVLYLPSSPVAPSPVDDARGADR